MVHTRSLSGSESLLGIPLKTKHSSAHCYTETAKATAEEVRHSDRQNTSRNVRNKLNKVQRIGDTGRTTAGISGHVPPARGGVGLWHLDPTRFLRPGCTQ